MAVTASDRPDEAITIETDDGPGEPAETEARLKQVRSRFDIHQTFWSEIQSEGLEDDKFVGGEHWPEEVRKEREEDHRPILTYNLLPAYTRQITNKVREERSQVKVVPVESDRNKTPQVANMTGTRDYSLADIYSGIIKNIEHVSRADQAYDTAIKHAVDHGFGYFKLRNRWSRADPFVQELVIERVRNSYTVFLDPDAQEADYRDMQDAFIFGNVKKTTFEEKYPDATHTEFAQTAMGAAYDGWYDTDSLRLAQYFWIDWKDDEVLQLNNGKVVYFHDVKDVLDELKQKQGIHIVRDSNNAEMRKDVVRPVAMWQKMTARDVLEGPLELPFSAIPIFPVLGEELIIDGRTRYESAIRHAKDAQKSYNYFRTAAVEAVGLAPKAPWVGTEAQFAGHEDLYEQANTRNLPYLTYNHKEGVSPPARVVNSQVAAAELQNATQDAQDIQSIIGLHEANIGAESNEISGKAILARQAQGSTSTYHFPENLSRAKEQCGRLMVEAIPKIYDTARVMRIRLPDDTDDFVEINQSVEDEDSDRVTLVHDISYGRYDVVMEVGKSYKTQRQEAAELQMEILKVLGPEKAANIVHLIIKNLGIPGSDEVSAVLRKMLPDALKSEDEKIADLPKGVTPDPDNEGQYLKDGEPWSPPPTPEMQLAQKQQEIDELKFTADKATADAKMATAEADKKQAEAKIAEAEAKMAELQSEIGDLRNQIQEGADSGDQMTEIAQLIEQTMKDHQVDPEAHKAATAEQIAEAVVDALKRTRAYVDRSVKATSAPQPIAQNGAPSSAPGTGQPAGEPGGGGGVNINIGGPVRLEFEYDGDGNITAAEAVAKDEPEAE